MYFNGNSVFFEPKDTPWNKTEELLDSQYKELCLPAIVSVRIVGKGAAAVYLGVQKEQHFTEREVFGVKQMECMPKSVRFA